jgi:hypothetical protein
MQDFSELLTEYPEEFLHRLFSTEYLSGFELYLTIGEDMYIATFTPTHVEFCKDVKKPSAMLHLRPEEFAVWRKNYLDFLQLSKIFKLAAERCPAKYKVICQAGPMTSGKISITEGYGDFCFTVDGQVYLKVKNEEYVDKAVNVSKAVYAAWWHFTCEAKYGG